MSDQKYPMSLADLGELSEAEKCFLADYSQGRVAEISPERPTEADPSVTIRAGLIRLVALGNCSDLTAHPRGVMIDGAWISGHLDIAYCTLIGMLRLSRCRFEQDITAVNTKLDQLALDGCHLTGFKGHGLTVSLSVLLSEKFRCDGEFDLVSAKIGGHLSCTNASFYNPTGRSLNAHSIDVKGGVFLNEGFISQGEVSLIGATIGGQLAVQSASFSNDTGIAFAAQDMTVGQIFFWRKVTLDHGTVLLTGAHVDAIADDLESWPKGQVMMDGLTYGRFTYSDASLEARLNWLESHTSNEFQPQPHQQLAKVFGEMGHRLDQGRVLMEMEGKLRANQREDMAPSRRWRFAIWDWVLRVFTGYGYRPWRVSRLAAPLIIAVALFGYVIWHNGDFAPAQTPALMSQGWQSLASGSADNPAAEWSANDGPGRDYETFNPTLYAIDLVVPLVNLGQEDAWAPSTSRGWPGKIAHWVLPIVEVLGWIITALGAAAVTGVIRRE